MINRKLIQKEQALNAISKGEFENSILLSKQRVVVVLTQDWCPQWHDMKNWIYRHETGQDIDIYELEYNRVDYFNDFMNFKESHWGNYSVPYMRFYKDGVLIRETNYISEGQFSEVIEM